jgi:hypothetical protein
VHEKNDKRRCMKERAKEKSVECTRIILEKNPREDFEKR